MAIQIKGNNVLLTGAAHGIGASLATLLAKEGCNLFLIDIDKAKLAETAMSVRKEGIEPILMVNDLSTFANREALFSFLEDKCFSPDILINNIGIGYWRYFKDTPWDKLEQIIDTNVKCMTHMTRRILPDMVERNSGYIVNLSSTAAFIGSPNSVCYSATKAYIRIFSETLGMELKCTGVKVLCVFPGATNTHFWQYAMMRSSKYDNKVSKMNADDVTKEIILAIKSGKSSVITGAKNRFNMIVTKFLPRELLKQIALKRFKN
tara:strand:- start:83 stop:871 length:789 start_codon:yes stop_codon:yes gene_type:complete